MCGGTQAKINGGATMTGLSPRVRGNPQLDLALLPLDRSIPACAGEPILDSAPPRTGTVYPRVCGGTKVAFSVRSAGMGLSPRVRGNP